MLRGSVKLGLLYVASFPAGLAQPTSLPKGNELLPSPPPEVNLPLRNETLMTSEGPELTRGHSLAGRVSMGELQVRKHTYF
jgi:hypothetical protein